MEPIASIAKVIGYSYYVELIPKFLKRTGFREPVLVEVRFRSFILELPHLQKRHQKGQRRLRTLILVWAVRMKSIATTAGAGVVQGGFQVVIAQKPIERSPGLPAPTRFTGCTIRLQTR